MKLENLMQYRKRLNLTKYYEGADDFDPLMTATSSAHTTLGYKADKKLMLTAVTKVANEYTHDKQLFNDLENLQNPRVDIMGLQSFSDAVYLDMCYCLQYYVANYPNSKAVQEQNQHHCRKNGDAKHWCKDMIRRTSDFFSANALIISASKSNYITKKLIPICRKIHQQHLQQLKQVK